jgi:hypothetical protein
VRVRLLPPQALLARLDDKMGLLTGGARDLPERQQTLRNTLDWSFDLLSAREQALFARLGVFAGTFDLPAAEALGAAGPAIPGPSARRPNRRKRVPGTARQDRNQKADTPGRTWTAPKWLICTHHRIEANARRAASIRHRYRTPRRSR